MTRPRESAPNPPGGWNVMQVGQIGWHVVQSGDGWRVSRLFGPSILPQDGKGNAVSPDPVATREGGHGAADAPAREDAEARLADVEAENVRLQEALQSLVRVAAGYQNMPGYILHPMLEAQLFYARAALTATPATSEGEKG